MTPKSTSPTGKKIKYGAVELEVNQGNSDYVPVSEVFIENKDLIANVAYAISENMPVLLVGDTGTGKTSAIRYLAQQTNNSFRRLNLNGQTTADEFVGKILVNEKGTYWSDGILTEAMRKGHWLLLDEINAALPEILFVLQSLLDDDRYIVLSDRPEQVDPKGNIIALANEIVRPHPNFRIFAGMNPSDGYAGTKELNKALMSRFPLVLNVDYPIEDKEVEIVKSRYPTSDEYELRKVIEFGNQLRATYREGELDFIFSTRELLNWVRINEHFANWAKSAEVSFVGKCSDDDKEKVRGLIKIHFASEKMNTTELNVGDEFIVFQDVKVFNTKKVILGKTSMKIEEISNKVLKVNIVGTPREAANNTDTYTQTGERWGVRPLDIEGNFQLKKRAVK